MTKHRSGWKPRDKRISSLSRTAKDEEDKEAIPEASQKPSGKDDDDHHHMDESDGPKQLEF